MRRRRLNAKRQSMMVIGLICSIFACSVGYAVMTSNLKIEGVSEITTKFDVYIESIKEKTMTNSETVGSPSIKDKTNGTIEVNLNKKGATAVYDVVVKNGGNVDVVVTNVAGIQDANNMEPRDITVTTTEVEKGIPLPQGETMTFQIIVKWDPNITTSSSMESKAIDFQVEYQQNIGQIVPPIRSVTKTENLLLGNDGFQVPITYTVSKNSITNQTTVSYRVGQLNGKNVTKDYGTSIMIELCSENQAKNFYMMKSGNVYGVYGASGDIIITNVISYDATSDRIAIERNDTTNESGIYDFYASWQDSELK